MPAKPPARISPASLSILLGSLYIAQGLPSGFFAHALPVLLREQGVSLTWISLAKLLAMPWFFKFLWAPWVDRRGSRRFGHYSSWILSLQSLSLLLVCSLSLFYPMQDPTQNPTQWAGMHLLLFLLAALLINTCLATQDIATDALAIKLLPISLRGWGNSIQVAGYKLGMLAGGNGLLILMAVFEWHDMFIWLAIGLLILMLPVLFFTEPQQAPTSAQTTDAPIVRSLRAEWQSLLSQPAMHLWLPVLLTYKIADSLASGMIKPLLFDSGFSIERIGHIGMAASIAGIAAAFSGGLFARQLSSWHALLWAGGLQAAGLAAWALVPMGWHSDTAVYSIALFEQMADALSTVALFAAMMGFCRPGHEGSDYTVQMSLFMLVSGTLSLGGGFIASVLGAPLFFIVSGLLATLCLLAVVRAMSILKSTPMFS
jgi:MFS family permease